VVGADASRTPLPERLGPATTLPRHPTNVFQDASTRAENLDEFNVRYVSSCQSVCLPRPLTWSEFGAREALSELRPVLENDPRPFFEHQANLAGDRLLEETLGNVLDLYRRLVRTPFAQPTMTEALQALERRTIWQQAISRNEVVVTRIGSMVRFRSTVAVAAPLTVGGRLRWLSLRPGRTEVPLR
jgi:hypothetical protein